MTRNLMVKQLPCVACSVIGRPQETPTESHHLLIGGRAGQKRRGDQFTVALCSYHHRSVTPPGHTARTARALFGPSLARQSKLFRATFGDDQALLERTNALLEGVA